MPLLCSYSLSIIRWVPFFHMSVSEWIIDIYGIIMCIPMHTDVWYFWFFVDYVDKKSTVIGNSAAHFIHFWFVLFVGHAGNRTSVRASIITHVPNVENCMRSKNQWMWSKPAAKYLTPIQFSFLLLPENLMCLWFKFDLLSEFKMTKTIRT